MFVERGSRPIDPRRRCCEGGDGTDLLDLAQRGVPHRDRLTVVTDLLVVETLLAEARQLERDVVVGQEDLLPVFVRLRRHRLPEEVLPGLGVFRGGELRLLVEAGIVEGVLDADRPAERVRLVGEHLREDHPPAVLRGDEEAVAAGAHHGRHRRRTCSRSRRPLRVLPHHGAEVVERVEALDHGRLDHLAAPRGLAREERGEDPLNAMWPVPTLPNGALTKIGPERNPNGPRL